jgi:hypothetical protein
MYAIGDFVRVAHLNPIETPAGTPLRLRFPPDAEVGAFGQVSKVTKTAPSCGAVMVASAPSTLRYYPEPCWYVEVTFESGRRITFLAGQLHKLSLIEVLAWVSR